MRIIYSHCSTLFFFAEYLKSAEMLNGPKECSIGDLPEGGVHGHNIIITENEEVLNCGGDWSAYSKICYVYDKESQTWKHHSDLMQARYRATSITMPNGVFIFGGQYSPTTYEYLAKNDKLWQEVSGSIPNGFQDGCGVRLNNNEVALVGGEDTDRRILKYNTATNMFKKLSTRLQKPRVGHSCITLENKILVVGGYNEVYDEDYNESQTTASRTLASSEIINMSDGTAGLSAGDLNSERNSFGLATLGGNSKKILAFGGTIDVVNGDGLPWIDSVEEYDEETRQWHTLDIKLSQKKFEFGYQAVPTSVVCLK